MIPKLLKDHKDILKHRYKVSLGLLGFFFISLILGFSWLSIKANRASVHKSIQNEAKDLKQFVEGKIIFSSFHINAMRYTIQNRLRHPEVSNTAYLKKLIKNAKDKEIPFKSYPELSTELGDLQIDITKPEYPNFYRDLGAAVAMIPEIASVKDSGANFVWSYYYDAKQRWELSYPLQSREEILRTTGTKTIPEALKAIFNSGGIRPLDLVGARNNPERKNIWTPLYLDASGEGFMVTILAPIYLEHEFIGAVGVDISMHFISSALQQHPMSIGRTFVIDTEDNILADSARTTYENTKKTKLSDVISSPINSKDWIVHNLNNAPLRLAIYIDPNETHK